MEKFVYYTKLFDCYKGLLNDNERNTFSYYYEENLSMQEIADNKNVSKSAIGSTIKTVEMKLTNYEKILQNEAKNELLEQIKNEICDKKIQEKIEKVIEM